MNLKGGTLSVDDRTVDKPYSQPTDLIGYFWSGKHPRVVKGLSFMTLYDTDPQGQHAPINDRLYDKTENKTKNDYFQEMFADVLAWGLEPAFVTGDSWYSSKANLKMIKNHHQGFLYCSGKQPSYFSGKGSMATGPTVRDS